MALQQHANRGHGEFAPRRFTLFRSVGGGHLPAEGRHSKRFPDRAFLRFAHGIIRIRQLEDGDRLAPRGDGLGGVRGSAVDFFRLGLGGAIDAHASAPARLWSGPPASERCAREASGSFYSGHANAAFLAAVYLSYTYPQRHPDFRGQAWLWSGSLTVAAIIAGLWAAAGKHFPSDVIVGAAAGALFGWGFPYLHEQSRRNPQDTGGGASSMPLT